MLTSSHLISLSVPIPLVCIIKIIMIMMIAFTDDRKVDLFYTQSCITVFTIQLS